MSFLPKISDSVRSEMLNVLIALPLTIIGTFGLFALVGAPLA